MKNRRQEKILDLIMKYEIETQEEMISKLLEEGYNVTQATISRDMRELKLTKVLTAKGTYKYAADNTRYSSNNTIKINTAIADAIIKVDYALNTIVIKTFPGLAQAVASGVDSLNMECILGCVGGDDTIIVVTTDEASAKDLSEKIRELMKVF